MSDSFEGVRYVHPSVWQHRRFAEVHSLIHPNFGTIRSGVKEKPGDLPAIGPLAEREWNGKAWFLG